MKDTTKILDKFRKDLEKAELTGGEKIHTLKEAVNYLAEKITMVGGVAPRNLFKKYAKYEYEYVKEEMPIFYSLIEDDVKEMLVKEKAKKGATKEQAKEFVEMVDKLESIEGNRVIGYARVSTAEQNLDRQIKALNEAGCHAIFKEKISGKNTKRAELQEMLGLLKAGDTVIVSELTRLARSTTDLFNLMAEFEKMGVAVKSLKESWLDTTTAHGRLMFTIMSGLAQFERDLTLERQQEGIKVAKEKGVKFGIKLDDKADIDLAIQLVKEGNYTMTQIANMCHISRTTLWRKCRDLGINK